jgi:hypothetical protein
LILCVLKEQMAEAPPPNGGRHGQLGNVVLSRVGFANSGVVKHAPGKSEERAKAVEPQETNCEHTTQPEHARTGEGQQEPSRFSIHDSEKGVLVAEAVTVRLKQSRQDIIG